MKKLKTIAQRKKWNMILGISDIIMMIIASYLALLTRFEFYPSQIAPIFLKNAAKIHAVESLLQYCDLYGISIVFNAMEVCRNLRFY